MKALLIATILMVACQVSSKVATCRDRLRENDNQSYCTKFSAPANSKVEVELKGRLLNVVDSNF